jgi:hypothetical protein
MIPRTSGAPHHRQETATMTPLPLTRRTALALAFLVG